MRSIFLLFFAFFLISCSSTTPSHESKDVVVRIKKDCAPCSRHFDGVIKGHHYSSDIPIECCTGIRPIDTSSSFTKVYIHGVFDLRSDQKIIQGKKFTKRLDKLFYLALKKEIEARGMLVVDTQTSPYTLRVDFDFTDYKSTSSKDTFHATLDGFLTIKNINYTKKFNISTYQRIKDLGLNPDYDLFVDLLAKQAANKVAEKISKF